MWFLAEPKQSGTNRARPIGRNRAFGPIGYSTWHLNQSGICPIGRKKRVAMTCPNLQTALKIQSGKVTNRANSSNPLENLTGYWGNQEKETNWEWRPIGKETKCQIMLKSRLEKNARLASNRANTFLPDWHFQSGSIGQSGTRLDQSGQIAFARPEHRLM